MTNKQQQFLIDILTEDQKNQFSEFIKANPSTTEDKNNTALQALEDAINNTGFNPMIFIQSTNRWHRYLQNELFKLALAIIRNAASEEYKFDGRNEYAHTRAQEIIDNVPYL